MMNNKYARNINNIRTNTYNVHYTIDVHILTNH